MDQAASFQRAFGELDDMPFPPGSSIDEVDSLHADLVLYDGTVAGILLSENRTTGVPPFDAALLAKMKDALRRYPQAADELSLYISRLVKMEEVIGLARAAEPEKND